MAQVRPLELPPKGASWRDTLAADTPPILALNATPDAIVGSDPSNRGRIYSALGKRVLDVVVVLALAPLWVPVYLLVALAIVALDGRPVLYRTTRTGRGCAPYQILKFRTMRTDADEILARILDEDPDLRTEYLLFNKLKNDPRISRVGRFLRRKSLDELPQLVNVLKGDMSLVGPRPPSNESDTVAYYGALAAHVFADRPGLTGMWQVSDRHSTPYERKVWLDLIYASRCSLLLDLKILARTIPTVLSGKGAF